MESSNLTVKKAEAANSSCVHFSPCLEQSAPIYNTNQCYSQLQRRSVSIVTYGWTFSPGIDDMLLSATLLVAVKDQIAVTSIEMTVGGWVHRNLIPTFDTPHL